MINKGFEKIIERAFLSVYDTFNKGLETKKNFNNLIDNSSKKYAKWVVETFGTVPLFGINKTSHISSLHVRLRFTGEIAREKFRDINLVKKELLKPLEHREGVSIEEVIESSFIRVKLDNGKIEEIQSDVAILGIAGSGKTTTMKYIMLLAAQGHLFRGEKRFPFFISLRDVKITKGFIKKEISSFFAVISG